MCLRYLLQEIKTKKLEDVLIKLGKQEVIHKPKKVLWEEREGREREGA